VLHADKKRISRKDAKAIKKEYKKNQDNENIKKGKCLNHDLLDYRITMKDKV
jgi:hypothetical protein